MSTVPWHEVEAADRGAHVSHVVFVDANHAGVEAMRRAKDVGHKVSAILATEMQLYQLNARNRATLSSLDSITYVPSTTDASTIQAYLTALARAERIDAVITTLDDCVEPLSTACSNIGLPFTNADAVRLARNKHLARERLAELHIPSARFGYADSVEGALAAAKHVGLPAVVKPVSGTDSLLAAVVRDDNELRSAAKRVLDGAQAMPAPMKAEFSRGVLVEEWLSGELISVEMGVFQGKAIHYMVSQRRRARADEVIELGTWMPARLDREQARSCEEYAFTVCRALGLDFGIFHIELIWTEAGPRLVEANARLIGGGAPFLYKAVTGVSIHDHLIALHLGRPLPCPNRAHDRVGGTYSIAAHHEAVLPAIVDLSWLRSFEPSLVYSETDKLVAKRAVSRNEKIGRFQLVGSTHGEVEEAANRILAQFEEHLGLDLLKW